VTGEDEETVLAVVRPRKPRTARSGKPSAPAENGKVALAFTDAERVQAAEAVFEGMANGRTLAEMARSLGLHESTVRLWINGDEALYAQYQRRKKLLGQALADRALDVAMAADSKTFQADRLKVETLRWLASKVNQEEYGDRSVQETTGEVTLKIQVVEERMTPRQVVEAMPSTMRISAQATIADAVVESITPSADES
jgi:predicted transcriptional regulator